MFKILFLVLGLLVSTSSSVIVTAPVATKLGKRSLRAPEKMPIVYHEGYNFSEQLQRLHPFDGAKFRKVFQRISQKFGLSPDQFFEPQGMVTEEQLQEVHTKEYLASLNNPQSLASILEVPFLSRFPNDLLQKEIVRPMKLATRGTIDAVRLACKHGWAINLGGGYHHAKSGNGEGFCIFADIPLAVYAVKQSNPEVQRVLIVDLDAHQGNGFEKIFTERKDQDKKLGLEVATFDMYNDDRYPSKMDRPPTVDLAYNYPLHDDCDTKTYLKILKTNLPKAIKEFKPDIIIYNAGTDPLAGDELGKMQVCSQGIVERDEFVFRLARGQNIPITMLLSGGYTKKSAEVIGNSIINLKDKGLLKIGALPQAECKKLLKSLSEK